MHGIYHSKARSSNREGYHPPQYLLLTQVSKRGRFR